jgi:hypothetical protein
MTRKRVLVAMAAGLWLLALMARAQDTPAGVCCNNGVALAPQGQPCILLHRVGPGENLHILAAYYYGDARAWQRIYALNKKTIGNPNRIRAGQILRIEVPPCWTPRFDLQEFIRIEEARAVLVAPTTGERAKVHVSRETVEPKVSLSVEEEGGNTAGAPPAPGAAPRRQPGAPPVPAAPAPTSVQIEE